MTYLDIPSNSLPFTVQNSLTNQIYQQNLGFWKFLKNYKFSVTFLYISDFQIVPTLLQISVKFWKWYWLFRISPAIPRPLPSGIYKPINFTKKLRFLEIYKKRKWQLWIGISFLVIPYNIPGKNSLFTINVIKGQTNNHIYLSYSRWLQTLHICKNQSIGDQAIYITVTF